MTSAAPRLVLHVGAMKTGTTYLQSRLTANAEALAAAGWWVPERSRVIRAVREGLGFLPPPSGPRPPRWPSLLAEARERGGRGTVVSMEFLSYASKDQVAAVLAEAEGFEVEVVLTMRDALRAIPSQWQSLMRNQFTVSWPDFTDGVRAGRLRRAPGAAQFRRTQDLPRMLRAWSSRVPRERFAAITVPGPGQPHDLLWTRFLDVVGVPASEAPAEATFDNPRLGFGACEVLRLVNAAGLDAEDPVAYRKAVRRLTREHADAELAVGASKPRLDADTVDFALRLNRRTLAVAERLATLVGAPGDLPTELTAEVTAGLEAGSVVGSPPAEEVRHATRVLTRGAVALCAERDVVLPPGLVEPLPDVPDPRPAVQRLAAVMAVAMTRDPRHRPTPRAHRGEAGSAPKM